MTDLAIIAEQAYSAWHQATADGSVVQLGLGLPVETRPPRMRGKAKRQRVARTTAVPADEARVDSKSDPSARPEPQLSRLQAALRTPPTSHVPLPPNPRHYMGWRECVLLADGFVIRMPNKDRTEHVYTAFEPWTGQAEKFEGYGGVAWGQVSGPRAIRMIKEACSEAAVGRVVGDSVVAKFDAREMERC